MATNWKSQQGDGKYYLQFETDDIDKYKLVEKASRMAIDGITDIAEVKHGYRKTVTEAKDNTVCGDNIKIQYKICSNCEVPMGLTESDYCPNCGAKMEGGGKE